ncbi:MAG: hypothetical protein SFY95_00335 [Planctomycetota bacterium]|nr:hypothetical protein [Planctomycetota bacterium]
MSKRSFVRAAFAAGVAIVAVAPGAARASVVFTETEFAAPGWAFSSYAFGPNGGSGAAQQTTQGRTGHGLRITNNANNNNSGAWNVVLFPAFTYNPGASGPISSLSFSIDTRFVDGLQAVSFVVAQGGHVWRMGYSLNTSAWTTFALTNVDVTQNQALTAGAPLAPNLVSGGPVRFGFASANSSSPNGFGYTRSGLYDNFSVTFVPAPGAAAAALAVGALSLSRRRRA